LQRKEKIASERTQTASKSSPLKTLIAQQVAL